MRSRPDVKLLLSPGVVHPGERLKAEALLTSHSETPVDYVSIRLRGMARIGVGSGKGRSVYEGVYFEREWRSKAMKMFKGEMRLPAAFDLPATAPQTYHGGDAMLAYSIVVYVSIPWWPDRESEFQVPVVWPPGPSPSPLPQTFATSTTGPSGRDPFMEVSVDATQISVGDVVTGSISLQNLHGRKIRGIDLSFVETEIVMVPRPDTREAKRYRLRVHPGAPVEGAAIPFRVRLPENATPSFSTAGGIRVPRDASFFGGGSSAGAMLEVRTHIEIRAIVAWGEDIVLRIPLIVAAKSSEGPRRQTGWVAPVGRERQMIVWRAAAEQLGFVADAEAQTMTAQRGGVTVAVTAEHRDNDFFLIAKLGWPNLGLDLEVTERKWSDALAVDIVKSGNEKVDERFAAHVREPAQARAIIVETLRGLLPFDEATVTDEGARLAQRGAPHSPEPLERFCKLALNVAERFDEARANVVPPQLFLPAEVAAWDAMATELRGRLDVGRMAIRDAHIGTDSLEIESTWERRGILLGTSISVAIDPELESAFTDIQDPRLSPAARDAMRELTKTAKSVTIHTNEVVIELEGKLSDPHTIRPLLDLAVALRRALSGQVAAGPFR